MTHKRTKEEFEEAARRIPGVDSTLIQRQANRIRLISFNRRYGDL